jgi:LmbE family N-acetylglucosaminyl deacetylase
MAVVLVVAPHPDDETLGCGGTLLRHAAAGDEVHWLIATSMHASAGYARERIAARSAEIERVASAYRMKGVHALVWPTTAVDRIPLAERVETAARVLAELRPQQLYLPFAGDAHSDHRCVAEAFAAAAKPFRRPELERVLAYETLSETEAGALHLLPRFHPHLFVEIARFLEQKLEILGCYASELAAFPFPRSCEAVMAQARLRGAQSGFAAAEAFQLLQLRDPDPLGRNPGAAAPVFSRSSLN